MVIASYLPDPSSNLPVSAQVTGLMAHLNAGVFLVCRLCTAIKCRDFLHVTPGTPHLQWEIRNVGLSTHNTPTNHCRLSKPRMAARHMYSYRLVPMERSGAGSGLVAKSSRLPNAPISCLGAATQEHGDTVAIHRVALCLSHTLTTDPVSSEACLPHGHRHNRLVTINVPICHCRESY